jgi:hypothetical protein
MMDTRVKPAYDAVLAKRWHALEWTANLSGLRMKSQHGEEQR